MRIILNWRDMEHYFIEKTHSKDDFFTFTETLLGKEFTFKSCDDIFSKDRVDYGTKVLIETVHKNLELSGKVLDIGCGYGAIGIVLASSFENANFYLNDINGTAVMLSQENAQKNKAKNIAKILKSDGYEKVDEMFDFVITNPPIKAGKQNLLKILDGALGHLNQGGKLVFVIKKKHGEESVKKHLETIFSSVEILKRDSGYYILCCTK